MSDKRMGTVIRINKDSGYPEVQLDGTGEGDEIECLSACNYQPLVGDRVVLVRVAGRMVAEYAVGLYRS